GLEFPPGSATMHWQEYSGASTIPDSRQSTSVSQRLYDWLRRPGSRRRPSIPCAACETALIQEDSAHGRSSPKIPIPSTRYGRPGTPTYSLSRAGCSRTPVARSIQGSLGGSDHAPRSERLGFHRHTPPRCPVPQAESHFHSTKGLAPLSP